jgi:hydrogenase/urease accessory protein HupE
VFAYFHGHAHGAEAIAGSAPWAYVSGIVVSSVALLCASALLAVRFARRASSLRIDQPR